MAGTPIQDTVPDLLGGDTEACAYVDFGGTVQYVTGWHVELAEPPLCEEGIDVDEFFAPVGGTPSPGVLVSWPIERQGRRFTCRALISRSGVGRLVHLRVVQGPASRAAGQS